MWWENFQAYLDQQEVTRHLISSLLWLFVLSFLRFFFIRAVRSSKTLSIEVKRRWIVQIKNVSLILFFLGLVIIWAAELRNFAVSLVAVAAALAIVTKEMILCIMGGIYKTSTRAFDIGDRIEINHIRGDVVDHDFLRTTLYEIGPGQSTHQYTGKRIVLPNSLLLSNIMIVEKRAKFVLHDFRVPISLEDTDHKLAKAKLLAAAEKVCNPFVSEAQAFMNRLSEVEGVEPPNATPRVTIHFVEAGKVDLLVRIPSPGLRKTRTEQEIVETYLNETNVSNC